MNRTIFTGDNLDVLRGLDSGSVNLIYLDPPFNSNRNYSAPVGSKAAGAAFKDTWSLDDVDLAQHGELADRNPALYAVIAAARLSHGKGMQSYLIMMAVRLLEMRRVLADTGSIYLHCDPTANSYLRLLMDSVFGKACFRNEIVWGYAGPGNYRRDFARKHDTVLRYVRDAERWTFNADAVRVPHKSGLHNTGGRLLGKDYGKKDTAAMERAGKLCPDWWGDIGAGAHMSKKERLGYPTQKPLALLRRIIAASSNPGDVVLDPFCGCATTCVAAEELDRKWIGIDLSPLAGVLVERRLRDTVGLMGKVTIRTDIPRRADLGTLPDYRTHKHTLFGMQEGRCNGCRHAFPFRNFTVDHIVPQAKGGTDHLDNLQLLCGACNSTKGTNTQAHLVARLKQQGVIQ